MFVIPPHSSTPRWMPSAAAATAMEADGGVLCAHGGPAGFNRMGRPCKQRMVPQAKRKLGDESTTDMDGEAAAAAVAVAAVRCCSDDANDEHVRHGAPARAEDVDVDGDAAVIPCTDTSDDVHLERGRKRARLSLSGLVPTSVSSYVGRQVAELSPATFMDSMLAGSDDMDVDGGSKDESTEGAAPAASTHLSWSSSFSASSDHPSPPPPPTTMFDTVFPEQCLRLFIGTPTGHPHPYSISVPPTPPRSRPSSPCHAPAPGPLASHQQQQASSSRAAASARPQHRMRSERGAAYFDAICF